MNCKLLLKTVFAATFFVLLINVGAANAQDRQNLSGEYRMYFKGRFKEYWNSIEVKSIGKNKLQIDFSLIWPHLVGGEMSPHLGETGGKATLKNDTAVFINKDEFGTCQITLKFVKPGTLVATQDSSGDECGFGLNVTATGTYRKVGKQK